MGGLVALELAADEPVDAVIAIGTPLRLSALVAAIVPVVKHLRPLMPKRRGSDIRDVAARERHPSYDVMPLPAVHELMRLQRRVRQNLARITAPILVAYGAYDRTANPDDARRIRDGVSSKIRESMTLHDSGHVVPVDRDAAELAAAATAFLMRFAVD
jgi:esterase/lipase